MIKQLIMNERFIPQDKNNVRMYVCGPTVYDDPHIGNARPVVIFDILFKVLKNEFPNVTYVRNITDVDDKIIKSSQENNISILDLTKKITQSFNEDCIYLNCENPHHQPKATEHISEMIDWGTTTLEIKSGYGLNLEEEIKILRIIKYLGEHSALNIRSTLLAAHIIPPEYHMRDEKYVDLVINDIIPIIAKNGLADFNDVWCEKGAFTREQAKKILKVGVKNGLIPKIHADEMSDAGGAKLAAEMKAISADHLTCASEEGLEKMKEAGVVAVLLPVTTFSLGKDKFADGGKMVDMGLTVALGTDYNPGTSMCPSMPLVISFAVVRLKMDIVSALYGATLNAAKAIGMEDEVGSLEVGKRANVNVLDIGNYEEIPYRIGENYVETVVSNGEILK
jgi:imidazolonepropionase